MQAMRDATILAILVLALVTVRVGDTGAAADASTRPARADLAGQLLPVDPPSAPVAAVPLEAPRPTTQLEEPAFFLRHIEDAPQSVPAAERSRCTERRETRTTARAPRQERRIVILTDETTSTTCA